MTYREIAGAKLDSSCTVEEYFRDGWTSSFSFVFGSRSSLFAYLLRRDAPEEEDVGKSKIICPFGGGSWVWEDLNCSRERISMMAKSSQALGYDLYHLCSDVRPDYSAWLFGRLLRDEEKLRKFSIVMMCNYRYQAEKYGMRLVFAVMHAGQVNMGRVCPLHFHFLLEHKMLPGERNYMEGRERIWRRFGIEV